MVLIFEDVMFSFTTKFDVDELIWSIPQFLIFSANVSRHNIVVSRNVMVSCTLTSTLSRYNTSVIATLVVSPKVILKLFSR